MLAGICILLGAAVVCRLAPRPSGLAPWIAALGCVLASGFGIVSAAAVLGGGAPPAVFGPRSLPGGAFDLGLDPLSAFFLLLIGVLAPVAAVFGAGYLGRHAPGAGDRGPSSLFCLLVASMMLVVTARTGMLFLMAWEVMTLSSWALVVVDHARESVRSAGRRYLIASQLGGAALLAFFALLSRHSEGLEFGEIAGAASLLPPVESGVLLALAFLGFGTKAGLVPLHVWLPLAHPAAPSHVSALMSGVMVKMGIYGLLRTQALLGPPPMAFAVVLIAAGAVSAVYGIAGALAQRDLKRALACSSIENLGIVVLGLGLSAMASRLDRPAIAVLAAAGALLHMLNHMVMKGLLFLGAGAVAAATHTRDIEGLGGLLRRMPWTGTAFAAGAAAIGALPPFAGFASEFLILAACFRGAMEFPVDAAVVVILAGLSLAAAGGLAAASFARLFGVVFLGEPRSEAAARATEGGVTMIIPLLLLAAGSLLLGLRPEAATGLIAPVISGVAGVPESAVTAAGGPVALCATIAGAAAVLLAAVALLVLVRGVLPGFRGRSGPATWGCGYSRPTAKLQYTGSSFGRPLVRIFASLLKPRTVSTLPAGPFPAKVRQETAVPDRVESGIYEPLFLAAARRLAVVRRFQHGHLNKYLLQIVAALILGLLWAMSSRWMDAA